MTFEELYEQYRRYVYNFARQQARLTGDDADDVVAETFYRAWQAWDRFAVENPGGWLCRIAMNLLRDQWKHHQVLRVEPIEPEHWQGIPDHEPTPELACVEQEADAEALARLRRVLAALPSRQRTALEIAYLTPRPVAPRTYETRRYRFRVGEGHLAPVQANLPAVQAALGLNWGAAKSLVFRAREQARQLAREEAA